MVVTLAGISIVVRPVHVKAEGLMLVNSEPEAKVTVAR